MSHIAVLGGHPSIDGVGAVHEHGPIADALADLGETVTIYGESSSVSSESRQVAWPGGYIGAQPVGDMARFVYCSWRVNPP